MRAVSVQKAQRPSFGVMRRVGPKRGCSGSISPRPVDDVPEWLAVEIGAQIVAKERDAAMAVLKWKKLFGYYADQRREFNSAFNIARNQMNSGEVSG